jgi:hypothetical protein
MPDSFLNAILDDFHRSGIIKHGLSLGGVGLISVLNMD